MAITQASDLFIPEVAAEYARQAFVENISFIQEFMGAPGSPIEVVNDPVFGSEGQYKSRPVFKRMSNLVTRRDVTSTSTATAVKMTGGDEKMVKVHQ